MWVIAKFRLNNDEYNVPFIDIVAFRYNLTEILLIHANPLKMGINHILFP